MNKETKTIRDESRREYRGAAVNAADHDKATPCLEKADVKELNDNPRNDDGPNPFDQK